MPIKTVCPYCSNEAKIRDELDCKKIKCPGCKKPYVVGDDEDKQPCPSCDALMDKDGFLCIACGYNTRTGITLETSKPVFSKQDIKDLKAKKRREHSRAIKFQFLVVAPALALAGAIGIGVASRLLVSFGMPLVPMAGAYAFGFSLLVSNGWHFAVACGYFNKWQDVEVSAGQERALASLRWLVWGMMFVCMILTLVVLALLMPTGSWEKPNSIP